jgi:hypothetical protein
VPFNPDRLSEGLGVRFASPHGDRARPFPPTRDQAALDTLEPPSTPVLLPAEQAKDRLREIIEGLLLPAAQRRGRKRVGPLVVKNRLVLGRRRGASGRPADPEGVKEDDRSARKRTIISH